MFTDTMMKIYLPFYHLRLHALKFAIRLRFARFKYTKLEFLQSGTVGLSRTWHARRLGIRPLHGQQYRIKTGIICKSPWLYFEVPLFASVRRTMLFKFSPVVASVVGALYCASSALAANSDFDSPFLKGGYQLASPGNGFGQPLNVS